MAKVDEYPDEWPISACRAVDERDEQIERLQARNAEVIRANGEIGLLLAESWDERDRLRAALKQAYLDAGCREGEAAEMVQAVSTGGSES